MKGNLYGSAGNASIDPKMFMVQALKKVLLNNANIIKFYNQEVAMEEKEKNIRLRVMNTVALLNEMKLRLNTEEPNPAVEGVRLTFEWLIGDVEQVAEMIMKEDSKKVAEELEKKVADMNYVVKNILEGFEAIE